MKRGIWNTEKSWKVLARICAAVICLLVLEPALCLSAFAQGTAFTYQGRLNDGSGPANGNYDLRLILYDAAVGGSQQGSILTTNAVAVTNGLFTVALDFGNQFPGAARWMEIAVRTNGAATFVTLTPRQQLTPTPYAITAGNITGTVSSSQLSGPVSNGQLANSSITVSAGTGLSGGGTVALGGSTTLNNAGVTSLAGGGGVTVSAASGAVTLGSTATSANTPNTIVSRDGSGNFAAGSVTLAGVVNMPTNATLFTGSDLLLHVDGHNENIFMGPGAGNWPLTTAQVNTAVGYQAMFSDTTGGDNAAFGTGALLLNTSGYVNTAIGCAAMGGNTNGFYNTGIGGFALGGFSSGSSGSYNTAEGVLALASLTSGSYNNANGAFALAGNSSGTANTADGYYALDSNTNGSYNVAVGYQALYNNLNGFNNTAVGENALYSYTGVGYNTAIGDGALQLLTSGNDNIGIGDFSGYYLTTGSWNIEIGNTGSSGDNHAIKIGQQGTQTQTYVAGIYGTSVSGSSVYINSSGQLGATSPAFVQTATSLNSSSYFTIIDNTLCNGKPNAILIVTANGGNGTLPTYSGPVGVYYDGSKWEIWAFNGGVTAGMQFNVLVYNF